MVKADDEPSEDDANRWEGTISLDLKLMDTVIDESKTKTTNKVALGQSAHSRSETRTHSVFLRGNRTIHLFVKDGKVERASVTGSGNWTSGDQTSISDSSEGPELLINEQRLDFKFRQVDKSKSIGIEIPEEGGDYTVNAHGKALVLAAFQTLVRGPGDHVTSTGKAGVSSRTIEDNWKLEITGNSADPNTIEGEKPIEGEYPNLMAAVSAEPELLGWLAKTKAAFAPALIDGDEESTPVGITGKLTWKLKRPPNKAGWGGTIIYTLKSAKTIAVERPRVLVPPDGEGSFTEHENFQGVTTINFYNGETVGDAQITYNLESSTRDEASATVTCGDVTTGLHDKRFAFKKDQGMSASAGGGTRARVSIRVSEGQIFINASVPGIEGDRTTWLRQEATCVATAPCTTEPENLNSIVKGKFNTGAQEIIASGKLDPEKPDQAFGQQLSPDGAERIEWALTRTKKAKEEGGQK